MIRNSWVELDDKAVQGYIFCYHIIVATGICIEGYGDVANGILAVMSVYPDLSSFNDGSQHECVGDLAYILKEGKQTYSASIR